MAILCSGVQSRANHVVMILQFSLERKQKPLSFRHKNIYILLRVLQNEDLNTAKWFMPCPFFMPLFLSPEFCQWPGFWFLKAGNTYLASCGLMKMKSCGRPYSQALLEKTEEQLGLGLDPEENPRAYICSMG